MDRKLWREPFDDRALLEGATLPRGGVLSIQSARDALLFVEHGQVWLTQEHDSRDIVLSAGAWFRLDRDGTAVLQSRRGASVTLTAAADAPTPVIRNLPPGVSRRRHPLLRALMAWWLRRYRRAKPSASRRFAAMI